MNIFASVLYKCRWGLGFFSGVFILTSIIRGWPIHYALPVSGTITDSVTHEPIPNAVIECEWVKKSALGIIEAVSQGIGSGYYVSNERGEYRIPGKLSLHIFSWYSKMDATVRHPIYESFDLSVIRNNKKMVARDCPQEKSKIAGFYCAVKVMKLEDKYPGDGGPNSACAVDSAINEYSPYIKGVLLAGACNKIDLKNNFNSFKKTIALQPDHYCKEIARHTVDKWELLASEGRLYEDIGMLWVHRLERINELRQAKTIKRRLDEGCYGNK